MICVGNIIDILNYKFEVLFYILKVIPQYKYPSFIFRKCFNVHTDHMWALLIVSTKACIMKVFIIPAGKQQDYWSVLWCSQVCMIEHSRRVVYLDNGSSCMYVIENYQGTGQNWSGLLWIMPAFWPNLASLKIVHIV